MKDLRHSLNRIFPCSRWMRGIFGVALLAAAFALSGCLSKPALNKQTFVFNTPAAASTNKVTGAHVLGIKSLQIAPPFDGRPLVYRTGEFTYQRDPYAEFLSRPAELLVAPLSGMLLGHECFASVVEPSGAIKPDTLIEIKINELYGDISQPSNPVAVVAMRVTFISATNGIPGKVILQRNYSRWIPMKSMAPTELMAAWNQALVEIVADVVSDFHQKETEPADDK